MAKLIFECAIFSFILVQILSLSAFTNKDDSAVAVSMQNATLRVYGAQKDQPDPFEIFENTPPVASFPVVHHSVENASFSELAHSEAERIVREGDLQSFQEKLDASPAARFLLGL